MGFRFQKSVNFGAFRVNFSKSGVGYSVGVPGFRYTVMANGKERVTASLPGTGISYVEEYGKKNKEMSEHERAVNEGRFREVKNQSLDKLQSKEYEEFIAQCQQYLDLDKFYNKGLKYSLIILLCFLLLALIKVYPFVTWAMSSIFVFGTIYFALRRQNLYNRRIRLEYSFDDEPNPYTITKELMRLLEKSSVLRCIKGITTGVEGRVHAGATEMLNLHNIYISKKIPKLIDTNIDCYYIKFPQEELYVLPDKILLIANYKIAAINPKSLNIKYETTAFRETGKVPSDARIVGHSWLYVNNNGTPDRRYNNNREIPICQYGIITIKNQKGLNIVLLGSDDNSFKRFYDKWHSLSNDKVKDSVNLKKHTVPIIKRPLELSDEELYRRREIFNNLVPLQEKYDDLVNELASQKEHFAENENFLNTIISKGYVTENMSSTFSIYDYNINLMSESEIQKMFADLRERYWGIANAYEKYENECTSHESDNNALLEEYKNLVADVRNDYRQRVKDNAENSTLLWCELCNEINLWTYWQGIGNLNAKILLVGQDWGCAFDNDFDKFKNRIEAMNAGDFSVDYAEGTKYPTDLHLIELFEVLGYDLHKKSEELFFTNLILGYRQKGSTGGLQKEWFIKDVTYLKRLVNIIKPSVIICLGKDTFEVTVSELCKKKVYIDKFYQALDCGENYTTFELFDKIVRIYAVAHCGSYGVMNRKMYATNADDTESGMDLQKKDWMKIKVYLDEIKS